MIKRAETKDALDVATLASLLWPGHNKEEFLEEMEQLITSGDAVVFLAYEPSGGPIGFAQCQIRKDYVEGTSTTPVGYLEGLFVLEEFRNTGIARQLVEKCEQWSITKGCEEFASDCELDNEESLAVHLKLGFNEVNRIIAFAKKLK
ncbi:aminoglycoside 6'-N-acetyltransferase [Psychrobacillus sp. FSL K6-2684]|uniref:aminoglycoside 6'-N-acetyltransferase n=1 Tax=unclassified Psychrobacillus TaxID=2636677 RepID=UPI001245198C|nr:aminoglycoside 6'-N-acetyltransferase [Psychrobacillus sp. AK 1817]QEY19772.1 GNAT family N-acetyltransferase [Psychrobacillus sp. AK 1817]QGM30310.1 GNAT family N-acetyltransferase [Bacillus sp. N3536]